MLSFGAYITLFIIATISRDIIAKVLNAFFSSYYMSLYAPFCKVCSVCVSLITCS